MAYREERCDTEKKGSSCRKSFYVRVRWRKDEKQHKTGVRSLSLASSVSRLPYAFTCTDAAHPATTLCCFARLSQSYGLLGRSRIDNLQVSLTYNKLFVYPVVSLSQEAEERAFSWEHTCSSFLLYVPPISAFFCQSVTITDGRLTCCGVGCCPTVWCSLFWQDSEHGKCYISFYFSFTSWSWCPDLTHAEACLLAYMTMFMPSVCWMWTCLIVIPLLHYLCHISLPHVVVIVHNSLLISSPKKSHLVRAVSRRNSFLF